MAPRRTFPPFVTASAWRTAYSATWDAARKSRGTEYADDGTIVPGLSNGDAITLIRAWSDAATPSRFPFWYQFAAVAYGWSPDRDRLTTSSKQRDELYPTEIGKELWLAMFRLSGDLDDELAAKPKLITDWAFNDAVYIAGLAVELQRDGANASISWKIPTGFCIDKKTRRRRVVRYPCDSNGRGPINPIDPTGPRLPCDNPGDCDALAIDDPITVIKRRAKKELAAVAMLAFVAWLLLRDTTRHRAQRTM